MCRSPQCGGGRHCCCCCCCGVRLIINVKSNLRNLWETRGSPEFAECATSEGLVRKGVCSVLVGGGRGSERDGSGAEKLINRNGRNRTPPIMYAGTPTSRQWLFYRPPPTTVSVANTQGRVCVGQIPPLDFFSC